MELPQTPDNDDNEMVEQRLVRVRMKPGKTTQGELVVQTRITAILPQAHGDRAASVSPAALVAAPEAAS